MIGLWSLRAEIHVQITHEDFKKKKKKKSKLADTKCKSTTKFDHKNNHFLIKELKQTKK